MQSRTFDIEKGVGEEERKKRENMNDYESSKQPESIYLNWTERIKINQLLAIRQNREKNEKYF